MFNDPGKPKKDDEEVVYYTKKTNVARSSPYRDNDVVYIYGDTHLIMTPDLYKVIGAPKYIKFGNSKSAMFVVVADEDEIDKTFKPQLGTGFSAIRIACRGLLTDTQIGMPGYIISYPCIVQAEHSPARLKILVHTTPVIVERIKENKRKSK